MAKTSKKVKNEMRKKLTAKFLNRRHELRAIVKNPIKQTFHQGLHLRFLLKLTQELS